MTQKLDNNLNQKEVEFFVFDFCLKKYKVKFICNCIKSITAHCNGVSLGKTKKKKKKIVQRGKQIRK